LIKGEGAVYAAHYTERRSFITPFLSGPLSSAHLEDDEFRDGPLCTRVAIIDIDREAGTIRPGTKLNSGSGARITPYQIDFSYIESEKDRARLLNALESDNFIQVSCFATVLRTIQFFEEKMGRRIDWAFDGPQLLVIPRAGEMENAFYERESSSLQFYWWKPPPDAVIGARTGYAALSHDIVTHETAHAVLDGIAPDLYDASAPESLALHEALADLTAIVNNIKNQMLDAAERNVDVLREFSEVAEEFGTATRPRAEFLRSALNKRTLNPNDSSTGDYGQPNFVGVTDPHALSEVISGAVYGAFAGFWRKLRGDQYTKLQAVEDYLPAVIIEALNYLPPGEVSFADYGRALLSANEQIKTRAPEMFRDYFEHRNIVDKKRIRRESIVLCDDFARLLTWQMVNRRLVERRSDLKLVTPDIKINKENQDALLREKKASRTFVEENRTELQVPDGTPFSVTVAEARIQRFKTRLRKYVILQIRWEIDEEHDVGPGFSSQWRVPVGVTVVSDRDRERVVSLLATDQSERRREYRGTMLRHLANCGLLGRREQTIGPDGERLRDVILVDDPDGVMRLRGSGRTLHLVDDSALT
jgi:hypothetical protein